MRYEVYRCAGQLARPSQETLPLRFIVGAPAVVAYLFGGALARRAVVDRLEAREPSWLSGP